MSENLSFAHTIIPDSKQLNADDLIAGPVTCTIVKVTPGKDDKQPMAIHLDAYPGRPYLPCKGMRRVLLHEMMWGDTASSWAGRRIRLFREPTVKWAGEEAGGIQISGLSDIRAGCMIPVTMARGMKIKLRVDKLDRAKPATTGPSPALTVLLNAIKSARAPVGKWSDEDIRTLLVVKAADVPESEHARIIETLKGDPPDPAPVFDAPTIDTAITAAFARGVTPAAIETIITCDPKTVPADQVPAIVAQIDALTGGE